MKKLNLKFTALVATAVLLGTVFFVSCSKNQPLPELRSQENQETMFLFPEGTSFNQSTNADNIMEFTLPTDYEFITMNENQDRVLSVTNGGTITCDCTSGDGGCKPFSNADNDIGCYVEGCTTCVGTSSNSSSVVSPINFIKVPITTSTGEILNALSGFSPYRSITDVNEWISTPYISHTNIDDEVSQTLDKMLESVWETPVDDIRLDENAIYTPIYVKGYKLLMAVPFYQLDEGTLYIPKKAKLINASATCSGCSGDCKLASLRDDLVIFCDGCDSGCTLHTKKEHTQVKFSW